MSSADRWKYMQDMIMAAWLAAMLGTGGGFTDIEIEAPRLCHLVIEAKKGTVLPGLAQQRRYAR